MAARLEEAASTLKAVYSELPTYDLVVPALLEVGLDGLRARCKLTPGVPLKPMLAKPTKAIGEVLDRFESKRFTCEYKYDGERAQVHRLADGTVGVFSRNSEDMSKKYPDLVEQLPHVRRFRVPPSCCARNVLMVSVTVHQRKDDIVRVRRGGGRDRQGLGQADAVPRAQPAEAEGRPRGGHPSPRLPLRVRPAVPQWRGTLFIQLLGTEAYGNPPRQPLLHKPLVERRQLLREHFKQVPGEFDFAQSSDGETTEEIQAFLEESVKDGCEGLMVKMLEGDASFYEPSRRSVNWLKVCLRLSNPTVAC